MEDKNRRNQYLKIRVSQEEMNAIKKKFQNSGMETLSGFVRAMIFEGYIVQMDGNELRQIHKLASNIASNINQIAVRVNSTNKIYDDDISEIQNGVNKLWQPLIVNQLEKQKVQRLKCFVTALSSLKYVHIPASSALSRNIFPRFLFSLFKLVDYNFLQTKILQLKH